MATSTAARARAEQPKTEPKLEDQGNIVHLPHVALPHLPVPHLSMPTGATGRVLWWGGLATVAAFGVVDWPVAAVVAAGSWVAEQYAKQARASGGERKPGG